MTCTRHYNTWCIVILTVQQNLIEDPLFDKKITLLISMCANVIFCSAHCCNFDVLSCMTATVIVLAMPQACTNCYSDSAVACMCAILGHCALKSNKAYQFILCYTLNAILCTCGWKSSGTSLALNDGVTTEAMRPYCSCPTGNARSDIFSSSLEIKKMSFRERGQMDILGSCPSYKGPRTPGEARSSGCHFSD